MRRLVQRLLVVSTAICLSVSAGWAATAGGRPMLSVSAPAFGCPATEGAFVVLLDPARGMLLLSGAKFIGGHRVGRSSGGAFRVALPRSGAWELARAGSAAGPVTVWGAAYRVNTAGAGGCVAFDHEQFSSEGDLVTYVQWLVNDVYLKLPQAERESFPALRLAGRTVRLRLQLAGYEPVSVHETEGATIAFRVPGTPQVLLLRPFVLDDATQRVAIDLSIADQPDLQSAQKRSLGFVVASAGQPATLADPAMTISVESAH
ncbi:MAG: hypothetical protein EPN53_05190 [Acidobacteria bacterium]|nr:MAG: hypothetical protein EPN53_05190 [Acidobacteriota bacterium]